MNQEKLENIIQEIRENCPTNKLIFKYGAEKGRIVMLMVGISIMGIILFITNSIKIRVSNSLIVFLDLYFPIIFLIVAILLISISYFISKRIYLKKEF